ncbi:MAG: exodeoxyribonuclease III [Elusimicrobiota bacterium]|jgi:exodeoxyribonuclease-3|nr:exodeoxyribonuclease III [Elusimicrobiota bacterium]
MKIISWNINGIRAIYKKNFLDWFNETNADMICVQETKAAEEQIPENLKEIKNYDFYCSTAQKKGYSGTAIWSKKKPISVEFGINNDKFDIEGRIVKLEFKDFIIFNIYFPNGGASLERLQYKLDFYDYFISYLSKFSKKDIIVCGDFNTAHFEIDLARPKENENNTGFMPIERKKLDNLIDAGFIDTFRHFNKEPQNYTWWDYKTGARKRNVGWRLDYFFINTSALKSLKSAAIFADIQGSDHCPVGIEIY